MRCRPTVEEHAQMIDLMTELLLDAGMSPNHFRPQDYHSLTLEFVKRRVLIRDKWNMAAAAKWLKEFMAGCHLK